MRLTHLSIQNSLICVSRFNWGKNNIDNELKVTYSLKITLILITGLKNINKTHVTLIIREVDMINTHATTWEIPEGIREITQNDIRETIPLGTTRVIIPAGLTSIGSRAFRNCTGLTQIHLPEGVTSIGDGAFNGCTGLTQMILPDQFCTDAEKVRLGIPEAVRCIKYSEIVQFMKEDLNIEIEGAYPTNKQALLYRLSSDKTFHPDELKGLKDCLFNDVMKAIKYRYSQQVEVDIPGLNGLFGRPRIDQAVEVDQLIKLNFAQILSAIPEDLTSTLLSYMTVKDVMKYSQCKRGGSGLLSQSLFQPQEAGGNGAEQVSDMTASGTGSRP